MAAAQSQSLYFPSERTSQMEKVPSYIYGKSYFLIEIGLVFSVLIKPTEQKERLAGKPVKQLRPFSPKASH